MNELATTAQTLSQTYDQLFKKEELIINETDQSSSTNQVDRSLLLNWIVTEMEAMGNLEAYSYKVGIYHGMKRVLEKIKDGAFSKEGEGHAE